MPVAAGVVGDESMRALLATQHMPAERRRATALDRCHHLELVEAYMAGVSLTPCRPVAAEDIRDLQCRARHARRASGGQRKLRLGTLGQQWSDSIQRAHHL